MNRWEAYEPVDPIKEILSLINCGLFIGTHLHAPTSGKCRVVDSLAIALLLFVCKDVFDGRSRDHVACGEEEDGSSKGDGFLADKIRAVPHRRQKARKH